MGWAVSEKRVETFQFLTFILSEVTGVWWARGSRARMGATGLAGNWKGLIEALGQ